MYCFRFNRNKLTAVFLDHDRSDAFETKTFTRKISHIIKHRGYNTGGSYNNDIALLKVDQDLPMTGILKPVCLPPIGKSFTGETGKKQQCFCFDGTIIGGKI